MPFVKINNNRHFGQGNFTPVSMGIYNADGKTYRARSVVIRIDIDLCNQLWPRENPEGMLYLGVYEGIGQEEGFLQVREETSGYKTRPIMANRRIRALAFSVVSVRFKHYVLNDTRAPMTSVQHMVDGNSLIIECPDWLKFNPLTASAPAPAPEPPPVLPAFPETRVSKSTPLPPPGMPKRRGRPPKGGHHYS